MGRVSFQNNVLLAFGTRLVFWAGVGVLAYQRLLQESADQQWVEHTHLVLEKLESARANLTDQETNEKEYQISNDKSFAVLFQAAAGRLRSDLSVLLGLTSKQIVAELHAAEPGRSVEVKIAEGLKADGDEQLLRIALQNLTGNSWKFTGKRKLAAITFGIVGSNGAGTYFVGDNGAGFDPTYA